MTGGSGDGESNERLEHADAAAMASAVEALRRGELERQLLWLEPRSRSERFTPLFQRLVQRLADEPRASEAAAPVLAPSDRARARSSSDWPYRYVLAFHERLADQFYLDDLMPPLWRAYVGALYAGRECLIGKGESAQRQVVLPAQAYADSLLNWIELLGGDASVGLLSIVSGREFDDDGEFAPALSFVHACGLWALALREAQHEKAGATKKKSSSESLAAFAPLLVLARFTLRMRAKWRDAPAFDEASRRLASWGLVDDATLHETHRRVALVADLIEQIERTPPAGQTSAGELLPGTLVLVPKSGVTAVLASSGSDITVAGLGTPRTPVRTFAASELVVVRLPEEVEPTTLALPNVAALEAERERLVSEDWTRLILRG